MNVVEHEFEPSTARLAEDTPLGQLVLAGNPNVGKSVFFHALTGMYVDVSNYPGTTVDVSTGHHDGMLVSDTPGVYGVGSYNDEEMVARDIILTADVVLNVVSASTLERDLFLTQQLLDMRKPMVVALNQCDEARTQGIAIDHQLLSRRLGVPVIPCVATSGIGIPEVLAALKQPHPGHRMPMLVDRLSALVKTDVNEAEALLLLEDDPVLKARLGYRGTSEREAIYAQRRAFVDELVQATVQGLDTPPRLSLRLGAALLNPWWGTLVAFAILALMYAVIGDGVAQRLVELTEERLMQGYYEPFVRRVVEGWVPSDALQHVLVGEFGLLTMTVTYILGLMLPLVVAFYAFMAMLEDTGYLPRLAVLVDRGLSRLGLNGRAVIPLILGFGCVTMATITTRLLGTQREKTIATAILGLTVPCSAQLGVILGLLGRTGNWQSWAIYIGTMGAVLVLIGTALNRLLPGQSSALLIDLPPLRLPQWRNVARKTWNKSVGFLAEATPLFMIASLLVSLLQLSGWLNVLMKGLAPLVVGVLHLPEAAATAFLMGMIRRDFGAAGMTDLAMTPAQVVISLVVITLFVPCIATVVVLYKERGVKEASTLWLGSWVLAFSIGGLLAALMVP
jgi:ferrous iron transport protein B